MRLKKAGPVFDDQPDQPLALAPFFYADVLAPQNTPKNENGNLVLSAQSIR